MTRLLAAVGLAALLLLTACGGKGTATGEIVFSGGPLPSDQARAGTVVVWSGTEQIVSRKLVDGEHFRFELAPGKYRFQAVSGDARCADELVLVGDNLETAVRLECQVK
ncbi:hypothetical protein [Dactylosporangium salmoneum]|uniref:Carboxypeptidase regulatory-like domain-containing protein n=1 Tax=Dactylosporangium salmoneum TaxID=53361 RepID=A0ABP5TNN8_9ACTN